MVTAIHYIRKPFRPEPDFGVTSVNYDLGSWSSEQSHQGEPNSGTTAGEFEWLLKQEIGRCRIGSREFAHIRRSFLAFNGLRRGGTRA